MNQLIAAVLNTPRRIFFDKILKCRSHKNNKDPPGLDSFMTGSSARYIEDMYNIWLKDPSKVHASWDAFFRNSKDGAGYYPPPTLGKENAKPSRDGKTQPATAEEISEPASAKYQGTSAPVRAQNPSDVTARVKPKNPDEMAFTADDKAYSVGHYNPLVYPYTAVPVRRDAGAAGPDSNEAAAIEKHMGVQAIIRAYQVRGHLVAKLDPLGSMTYPRESKSGLEPPDIITSQYKINESELDKPFRLPFTTSIGGKEAYLPLREIINRLEKTYCQHIGLEYMFINSVDECTWIREQFEAPGATDVPDNTKKLLLARLAKTQTFEAFCSKKYPNEKRFGLEGLEVMIPCIKTIMDRSSELGVEMFVIGMAHRGRLNVLVNVCRKTLIHMFAFFEPLEPEETFSGDVKYHLGVYSEKTNRISNKNMKISLIANPSHLGCGLPAVVGKVRAEQFFRGDTKGKQVMGIMLHGDAAFTGQGVHFELLNIAAVPCYTTHGIIHIVANNRIGFTTDQSEQGSSPYCTDLGRVINAPIFHVNADQPESVVHVAKVAAEWREKFGRDTVIDLMGYRRFGHQEVDDPNFTQPVLYKQISKHVPVFNQYSQKLINEKLVTEAELKNYIADYEKILEEEFQKSKLEKHIRLKDWLDTPWDGFFQGKDLSKMGTTGIPEETLSHICKAVSSLPPPSAKFSVHKNLQRVLKGRQDLFARRIVDWSMGEACAFGSLLKEGIPVRLTGEDVERGTFSHRHHIYHHQDIKNEVYCPLKHLYADQANYTICNSTLAEYSIMGYEHGYTFVNPNALVLWEAQFGDFANTAQPIFDQMVSSAEDKWARQSGFVAMLPHGLEGQGPEHSSCRPERILDLISEDSAIVPPDNVSVLEQIRNINMIVTNCTTPANHFHALRRQILFPFRKPILMMTPKGLLRHPEARSSFDDMKEGTEFKRIIPDDGASVKDPGAVQKVMFCSGKVFYDIRKALIEKKVDSKIAIVRIEQLAPFPFDLVKKEIQKYPKAKVCWLQEEHKNQGFWDHLEPRLRAILKSVKDARDVTYIGRAVSPTPATGFRYRHLAEIRQLIEDATKL